MRGSCLRRGCLVLRIQISADVPEWEEMMAHVLRLLPPTWEIHMEFPIPNFDPALILLSWACRKWTSRWKQYLSPLSSTFINKTLKHVWIRWRKGTASDRFLVVKGLKACQFKMHLKIMEKQLMKEWFSYLPFTPQTDPGISHVKFLPSPIWGKGEHSYQRAKTDAEVNLDKKVESYSK